MFKKIIYICFSVYFILSIICGSIISCKLGHYRRELNNYRIELERARDQQCLLDSTINECINYATRGAEIFSSTSTTIGRLKEQIKEARAIYENMERLLCSISSSTTSSNYTNLRETEKIGDEK